MKEKTEIYCNGRPSAVYTLLKGINKRDRPVKMIRPDIPDLKFIQKSSGVSQKHLERYNSLFLIENKRFLSPIYPLMLVYPATLRLFSQKPFPLNMFSMLNKRTEITFFEELNLDDNFDIETTFGENRILEKGIEVDVVSTLRRDSIIIWKAVNTFYFRGQFGAPDEKAHIEPVSSDYDTEASWFLKAGNGFRYARLSGDSNGIHYSGLYAKMMGFRRDFAQPMSVAETCLRRLPDNRFEKIDLRYKGQVYYDHTISLRSFTGGGKTSFNLFCEGNERPCLSGIIS